MNINGSRVYAQKLTRSKLTLIGEAILALTNDRTIIQRVRKQLLTTAIRQEMEHPEYDGSSSFIAHMVHRLCRIYDFRDLKKQAQPIKEKSIYNESINLWKELSGQEEP